MGQKAVRVEDPCDTLVCMTQLPALEGHEVVPFASAEDAVSWKPKRR